MQKTERVTDEMMEAAMAVPVVSGRENYVRRVIAAALSSAEEKAVEVAIVFGLEAQGHIPAVEAALAEGADWQEIGRRINWDGATAKAYYERHLSRSALVDVPAVESEPDLDARMKAAGMYTIAEMMGVTPLTKWKSNPAINTIDAFSEWLDRRFSEYLAMKAGYDLGDKSTDDELYEWVEAHAAVYGTIRDQFQVVSASLSTPPSPNGGDTGEGSATITNGGDHD